MDETYFDLTEEMDKDLVRRFIICILNTLLLDGSIDKDKAKDPEYLKQLVYKNAYILDDPSLIGNVEIHHEFFDSAKKMVYDNKPVVAIVLICSSIEQMLNLYFRRLLEFRGISEEDITKIIKRTNFETKTGWLMPLVAGHEFPQDLKKRILELVDMRNSIVQYKAVPGPIGGDKDSYSSINAKIKKLDYEQMLSIPKELEQFLERILEQSNPEYKMAKDLSKTLFAHLKI